MFWIRWSAVLVLFLLTTSSTQADFVIDDFSAPFSINNAGGFGGSTTAPGIFGGSRGYSLQVTNSSQQLTINSANPKPLNLVVTPTNALFDSTMELIYNDTTPSEPLGQGNDSLLISNVATSGSWNLTVSFTGVNSAVPATFTTTIPSGFANDLKIPLGSFSSSITGLGNISQLSLRFNNNTGATPQLSFGTLSLTAVPEPSFALSILGLATITALRRKAFPGRPRK